MYVDPQKARQERERQERERQARIKAEQNRQAKIKAEQDRQAKLKAERDRKARLKAAQEAAKAAEHPDKKTTSPKADPKKPKSQPPDQNKLESSAKKLEKNKTAERSNTEEITWSKPGETSPIYGSSAPIYEQTSVPIAKETQTESKPKKPDDRQARTWTGEKAEPIIAQPHQISEPDPQWPLPPRSDLSGLKAKALAKKAAKEEERQNQLQQASESTSQHPAPNPVAPLFPFNSGIKIASTSLTPGMLETQAAPLLPQSNSALKVSSPKAPEHLAQNSFYQPPQPDLHRQIITRQPMNSAAELEVATIQQTYGFQNAAFARWVVESRLQQEAYRTAWVQEVLRTGKTPQSLSPGHDVGHFESRTSLEEPHKTAKGQFYYNVTLSAQADGYYRQILPQAKQVWIAEVARRQQIQTQIAQQESAAQQAQRNQQIAQQVAQLQAVKVQQRLQATQAAATQSKSTNGAVGLPPISFNRQYVVPQSLLTGSAPPQTNSQITPQITQPKIDTPSGGESSSTSESKGFFDAHFSKRYYETLFNQGNKEHNLLKLFAGTVGGGITNAYLGFTGLAEQGVKDSLELAHQGNAEGGVSGTLKRGLGYGLTFIPSQFTQERAPGSMMALATVPLAAAGATTKFGQAVLSNPVVQRAVLPAVEGAGALFSGKQLVEGGTGKDLLTGEQLSEEERVSRTGQAALGIFGTGYLLKDKGKQIIQGARAIPGNVDRFSQRLMGGSLELALPGGVRVNPAEVGLTQPVLIKAAAPQGQVAKVEVISPKVEAPRVKAGVQKLEPGVTKPVTTVSEGGMLRQVALSDIRYSQADVSPKMSLPDGRKALIGEVSADMKVNGFPAGAAPTIVEYPNGDLVSLDHRRLVAADRAGIKEVPANVYAAGERLPKQQIVSKRFRLKTTEPITDPRTGRVYHSGDIAETYGEATLFRSANQRMLRDESGNLLYPDFPLEGSHKIPVISTTELRNQKKDLPAGSDQTKDSREFEGKTQEGRTHDVHPDNINPGWKSDPNRQINCVNCSIATDATLGGSPASALPSSTKIPLPVLEEVYGIKAVRLPPSKKSVIEAMSKAGNGKRGIVYVIYGDIPPSAHVFNVENKAGTIIFYDGQQQVNTENLFDNIVHMRLLNTN